MCGRFTQYYTWPEVHRFLSVLTPAKNLRARYNIAPTDTVDVVRLNKEGAREIVSMRWGLVPFFWKKSLKEVPACFNARVETVAEKPMFREAFRRRRCIVPASGFYEWTGDKKERQPHLFTAADGSPILNFAGLWEHWKDPVSGEELLSCTFIVTEPSEWMQAYHDRMPAILAPEHVEGWLNGSLGLEVLQPAPYEALRSWPVTRRLNRAGEGDDDPAIIVPLAA